MGYDQHQQPSSSGALVAVIGVGLILAILGIVVVAASLFWVRASTARARAVAMEQRAVAELRRAELMARLEEEQERTTAPFAEPIRIEVRLDGFGAVRIDGEGISLDELKSRIATMKEGTSDQLSMKINADFKCPIQRVAAVLEVLKEVGDIDYLVVSSKESDESADESHAEN